MSSLRARRRTSAPPLGRVGLSKPVIRLKNVVLPAPLGPIRAVMMPRCTSRWLDVDGGHAAEVADDVVDHEDRVRLRRARRAVDPGHRARARPPGRPGGPAYRRPSSGQTLNRSSLLSPRIPCGRKITSSISATPTQIHANCAVWAVFITLLGTTASDDALDEDAHREEQHRAHHRAEHRGRAAEQQRGPAEERQRAAHRVGLHRRRAGCRSSRPGRRRGRR